MSNKTILKYFVCSFCLLFQQVANAQCIEDRNVWDDSWISCSMTINPNPARPTSHWMLFEFNQAESISNSIIWNANRTGQSTMGVNTMFVDYSVDGTTWQT